MQTDASDSTAPFNVLDVSDIVAKRGFGTTILAIAPEQIFDTRLAELWKTAQNAIHDIKVYLDNERFRINRDPR